MYEIYQGQTDFALEERSSIYTNDVDTTCIFQSVG